MPQRAVTYLTSAADLRSVVVGWPGIRHVRKAAGIDFVGLEASTRWMIAEVEMDEEPVFGFRHDGVGTHALGPVGDGTSVRVVLTEPDVEPIGEPTIEELRKSLVGVYGTDFGLRVASWISRFTDMSRQAAAYRDGFEIARWADRARLVDPRTPAPGSSRSSARSRRPQLC